MNKVCKNELRVRILLLISVVMYSVGMWGDGFTPTDGGLVVDLKPGQKILISTMVNGEEYFVCHYPGYTGGHFSYTNWDSGKGNFLKLIPQEAGATEPATTSIWSIDTALLFVNPTNAILRYKLDGIAYTMWSTNPDGNSYTLRTSNSAYVFNGELTNEATHNDICNTVFVVPTNRSSVTSFDPNKTLRTAGIKPDQDDAGRFNGEKGYGFLGLPYREVYWLDIPRHNGNPIAYSNASLVGFNTTLSDYKYPTDKKQTARPGQALYAFVEDKHKPTQRTIFRLYILNETTTSSCPDSYYFAYDEQDYKQYNKDFAKTPATYTTKKKIYTIDHLMCMERQGDTKYYQTDWMTVPDLDSAYYYVGYQNKYCHSSATGGTDAFDSQFKKMSTLPLQHMDGMYAPKGAFGRMIVDTTKTGEQNLGVVFRPAGVFLRVDAGGGRYRNIEMHPEPGDTSWICNEMWTITDEYAALTIKATLYSGAEFSDEDEGIDISGWSEYVVGNTVPLADNPSQTVSGDMTGWARVYTNKSSKNGGLEFVRAEKDMYVRYDNNGHFGATLPNTHAKEGETRVVLSEPRLLAAYEFRGWYTKADTTAGGGTWYKPGDVVTLPDTDGDGKDSLILYAQAKYTGGISVALSFIHPTDGKRYFLTHPNASSPRYAKARHFADWTDTYQGMSDANNTDSRFLSTYLIVGNNTVCEECADGEYVLDPRREMVHGAIDSVLFYEHFAPANEEYIGLYYVAGEFNKILANDTWAGLFQSTKGWPDPMSPCIDSTKLYSTHYLSGYPSTITRQERPNNEDGDTVYYNPSTGYFDGAKSPVTNFTISGVGVVDEHYVVLPDTTVEWTDTITFGVHQDEHIENPVWSKLIGKQLMLQMMVGDKITYFHPNDNKIITEYTHLRLNSNYRLDETFEYIRDARVESLGEVVSAGDKPIMNDRLEKNYFGRLVTSGLNTLVDVQYNGEYIDIIDTIRITLRPLGPNKIKEYYGRWKEGAPGLHICPDGSRYRDIIVRTKTAHHGAVETNLVLTPEYPSYNFTPLAGNTKQLNFTLTKVTSHKLLDSDGNVIREEIISEEDVTSELHLGAGLCSFTSGSPSTYFDLPVEQTTNNHVTLVTNAENTSGINRDTLVINSTATIDAVSYPVKGRVPLLQSALEGTELVWSAVAGDKRYFIMAGSGGLIFRQYELKGNTLYKKEDGKTQLIKGSANAANDQTEYITPWKFTYVNKSLQQLSLETEYGVGKKFIVSGETTPGVGDDGAAVLTYEYVKTNVDNDANFEEQVRLRIGPPETGKWLKLDATPALTLTTNSNEATVFYWTYLKSEYSLREQGAYPSVDQLVFGYNRTSSASVTACYKGRFQYAMLLDSVITYCSEYNTFNLNDLTNLSGEWQTNKTITIIPDARPGVPSSGLSIKGTDAKTQTTTIQPSGVSPTEVRSPAGTGPFVDIVDTLYMQYSLRPDAPDYVFRSTWTGFKSIGEANLKIPLIRKTYHSVPYDSLICTIEGDEHNYVFPAVVDDETDDHEFVLGTDHRIGTTIYDVDNNIVSVNVETEDEHTDLMDLTDINLAEIRLIDEYGNDPGWCEITGIGANTITIHCKGNGIRSPRSANVYVSYLIYVNDKWRFVHFRFQVAQSSQFQIAGNQSLIHSKGASGMSLVNGSQQVHENRNILYYYNPHVNNPKSTDQRVELPVRERNFYGWWRWYSLQPGEEDTDIPAERWQTAPSNAGKWNFPFRIIGGKVPRDPEDPESDSILVTQGRYTVFHVPSKEYNRKDPPSKAPAVYPPVNKDTVIYAVDLSVYYDNLPLSMKNVNQVDTAKLDTMRNIIEPTLSLREIYELHPWTEMAERLEGYKDTIDRPTRNLKYLEDHVVRAPTGNRLLLKTEQRYNYDNLKKGQHSESLLGYYMRDDNWSSMSSAPDGEGISRQDTMIWCGGWDAECKWYTYNPSSKTYTQCSLSITEANDFLNVPAKGSIPDGKDADTVIYCLRARSKSSPISAPDPEKPADGLYWFNICRYTIIYHNPEKYGPKLENAGKAIMTNTEIEEKYDVLEKLDFDYNKPGTDYTVYPHPLPWADASYGFAYPRTSSLPDNRLHNNDGLTNLANMGEYNLINRIPSFGKYWHKMEQHGGAANGYMIYCDGMSSAGQVAALSLESHLCEGQRLYFSAYVGNPGNESGKTCPSFTFSVQGKTDGLGAQWEDITSYMTGDLPQSNKWYQICFPIEQEKEYAHFRVRVYNMAANDDGNDFIIDDMRIFATKPPLMVYQANTTCKADNEADSLTHVVLRLDYQGFTEDMYEGGKIKEECYTIMEVTKTKDTSFLKLEDKYYNEDTLKAKTVAEKDTLYGTIPLPGRYYHPEDLDSVFPNLQELVFRFEKTFDAHQAHIEDPSKPDTAVFREGYIYEQLDDSIRPVLYIIHSAKMSGESNYIVHMAGKPHELMSSKCAMTRNLKVRNRIMLAVDGDEKPDHSATDMCANTSHEVSLHVKGTLLLDSVAPIEITGTCYNDWLLYGDTTRATSATTYGGYSYSDIVKVVRDILRADVENSDIPNANQSAKSFAEVKKAEMKRVQTSRNITLDCGKHPYVVLGHLVQKGFLTLYQSSMTIVTPSDSTVKYTIFPIPGSGSQVMQDMNIEVCPTPIQIALTSRIGGGLPLIIGGLKRPEEEQGTPITVLADEAHANLELAIPIDSLMLKEGTTVPNVALDTIVFLSTNDPEYREGVHTIALTQDRAWSTEGENPGYYRNGNDTLVVALSSATNYRMRAGYSYTFGIEMMTSSGASGWGVGDCPVGTVPFTISVVPDYLRWDPHDEDDNRWNNPDNWIGITRSNTPIHETANFAPLSSTYVVIPPMTDGRPYPVLPDTLRYEDSIQMVGFQYNKCKSIRFLPGAALSQQQRLEYDSVIADLSAPNQKWALRTSPVEGLLSGDIYMSNADLSGETFPWEVGTFDAAGRNYKTGNATFWLSLYSRSVKQLRLTEEEDTTFTSAAAWSAVTNAMKLPLKPAQGFAVYTRTASGLDATVRLPKHDDKYYYYTSAGGILYDRYEQYLQNERAKVKDPSSPAPEKVGKMAFYPGRTATYDTYTLTNEKDAPSFVFGNPTMGYIDIWGFISDNTSLLEDEFRYMDAAGNWQDVTASSLVGDKDTIVSLLRYLPPMHAIELKKKGDAATELTVTLNTNRIVTDASQKAALAPAPDPAPKRLNGEAIQLSKGIMTVTAVNPASPRCTSRLLLGQGFNEAVLSGEDAVLTTVNIDNFSMTNAPATPFNIYAVEGNSGLSIDLRDEIVNVPISFYNSDLPFEPNSYLWFTGVNNIDGALVLYDALLDIERPILDGICLEIETPETSHIKRYYIRRPGYVPGQNGENPVATGFTNLDGENTTAVKFIKNGHVFILRDGHVYSIYGQKIR